MAVWPKMYLADEAPREVIALAEQIVPELLVGDHPAIVVLRAQYAIATIVSVKLTGCGFFVNYQVPSDAPLAVPARIIGGSAAITAAGVRSGAGCVLFVTEGRLSMFEVFAYCDEWPEHAQVFSVERIVPLEKELKR